MSKRADDSHIPLAATIDSVELTEWTLTPEQIERGNPRPRGAIVWRSEDGHRVSGFWRCTEGSFTRTYSWTETALITAGSAELLSDDGKVEIGPGSLVVIPAGSAVTWAITEEISKGFQLSADAPLGL